MTTTPELTDTDRDRILRRLREESESTARTKGDTSYQYLLQIVARAGIAPGTYQVLMEARRNWDQCPDHYWHRLAKEVGYVFPIQTAEA